jgi:hypothetical protein
MRFELITEENLDDYTDNGEFPNFVHYPMKKLREDFYDVKKKDTLIFWGAEGHNIKSKNVTLKSIGKFDGTLEEVLDVLKSSLPPSQVMLVHTERGEIYRAIVPRRRMR